MPSNIRDDSVKFGGAKAGSTLEVYQASLKGMRVVLENDEPDKDNRSSAKLESPFVITRVDDAGHIGRLGLLNERFKSGMHLVERLKAASFKGWKGAEACNLVVVEEPDESGESEPGDAGQPNGGQAVDPARAREIGRQGERFIADQRLAHDAAEQFGAVDVEIGWLNRNSEQGLPYDIKLTINKSRHVFIEVKTTERAGNNEFDLSANEWAHAQEHCDNYWVYRVYLQPSGEHEASLIPDFVKRINDQTLTYRERIALRVKI